MFNKIPCYKGIDRKLKTTVFAVRLKVKGTDRFVILEKVRNFNEMFCIPPLLGTDIISVLKALDNIQDTRKSHETLHRLLPECRKLFVSTTRTLTTPGGRKIKMCGADIIDVE